MIISGGENISFSEVESALGACDAVRNVAAIDLPDDKCGERVHAVVVLHKGASTSAAEPGDRCRGKIAGYSKESFRTPRRVRCRTRCSARSPSTNPERK